MHEPTWPGEWLRGALSVCVLRTLAEGPTYGYAIAQALASSGLGTVKGGTLYPLLTRLEEAGFVEVEWRAGESGPGRKFYTLTPAGHAEQQARAAEWIAFTDLTRAHLAGEPQQPGTTDAATAPIRQGDPR